LPDIICFSKDWNELATSNHHVLLELAKTQRVLWLNSIATRTPNLASGRDLRKIVKKLESAARGPERVADNLWVYTPLVLPLPHSRLAQRANRELLRATLWGLRQLLGIGAFELWTFLPNVGEYVGSLGEERVVYYCIDEWSQFSYIDEARMRRAEDGLVERADVIFACTEALAERKRAKNPRTFLAPHGVDHALFARALDPATAVPPAIAALPQPVIGFYGTLQDWVDYPLIAELARRRPEWSFALVGDILADVSAVRGLANVHLLGRLPHAELPAACKGFAVGLIPYVLSERMRYVNPLKLREYLSAGLPVVSTAVPEVVRYAGPSVRIGAGAAEVEAAIAVALAEDSPLRRQERSDSMRGETWAAPAPRCAPRSIAARGERNERAEAPPVDERPSSGAAAAERAGAPAPKRANGATMTNVKHRVGLVGAGYISEYHLAALKRLAPAVETVGLCDLDLEKAKAVGAKFGVAAFPSLAALVAAGADAVHILTPPDSHAALALAALEAGCHVLIEKPLATSVADCERVGVVAQAKGKVASVNHSLLYDPQIVRALETVRAGKLGQLISVDILRGSMYPPYRGGPLPPQYRSAAYPFRDLGVHALYLFQAFLGPIEHVSAAWASKGGDPNLTFDEWRALVRCQRGLGQFQLSWNVKPMQSQLIVQGTKGVLRVDLFLMFQALRASTPLPKPIERVVNAVTDSVQPLVDVPTGVVKFVSGVVKPYQGLHDLVAAFYRHLDGEGPSPVTIADATTVVRAVEEVARAAEAEDAERRARLPRLEGADVLVTGASGGLGGAVVERLRRAGRRVRIFVRRAPEPLPEGVEVALGDLGDPDAVERAVQGVKRVVHVGAAMKGGWEEHECATVTGTRNVVDAARRHGVEKLVHISSMSVNDWAGQDGGVISESTPFEPRPEERGHYTRAKLEAEKIVAEAGLPAVILRPGQIFGGKIPLLTPAVARRVAGRFLILGDGQIPLPLVYLDDVVDAIVAALDGPLTGREVIQLVDPVALTQNDVLARVAPGAKVLHAPRAVVFAAGRLSEPVLGALGRKSPVSSYRLRSALARARFESDRAEKLLGWRPRVGVDEGIRRVLAAGPR
jgi:predicted dehydrogenase/nucleoside-diphosphate-sugar epimerase/glycosyltransferase involved in cell wall biosynthesis